MPKKRSFYATLVLGLVLISVALLTMRYFPRGSTVEAQAAGIAYVQGKVRDSLSSTSNSVTFNTNTTSGNTIIVGIRVSAIGRIVNVTDSQGNTYTKDLDSTNCGIQNLIFSATNIASGPDTVTVSISGTNANISFHVLEYAGLAKSNVFDKAKASCTTSPNVNLDSGNTLTTTQANELVVGFGIMQFNQTVAAYGPGFVQRLGSTGSRMWSEDRVVSSIGTYNASMTASVANNWNMMTATYKAESVVPDNIPPVVSNIQAGNIGQSSANVSWTTDEPADSQVEFMGTCPSSGCVITTTNLTTSHLINVSGLTPETTYNYVVKSKDVSNNQATSNNFSFTTQAPPPPDTTAPIITNINVSNIGVSAATISWTTDELSDSQVEFLPPCPSSGCTTSLVTTLTTSHSIAIFNLASSTTYSYSVKSKDAALNLAVSPTNSFTTTVLSAVSFPIKLSSNGLYLLDNNDQPTIINGDTGWSLIAQLSKEDAEIYLTDRAQRGYNLILVNLIEHMFASNAPANFYGDQPFTTTGNFNTPNEAYFAHADWVINKAAEKGITILLVPIYAADFGGQGWYGEINASSLATMRAWGQYVGNRYKNFPNIIWVVGGDITPSGMLLTKLREFALGVRDFDTTHLMTAHNGRNVAGMDPWPNEAWLNLNNVYSGTDTYTPSLTQYNRTPFKPFFLIEAGYEGEGSGATTLRSQAYWTILSGGVLGHIFGNCPIWHFNGYSWLSCSSLTWQSRLSSSGSITLGYVGNFFKSRQFYNLIPDQSHTVMTAGYQSGTTVASTARVADGSTIISYLPTQRTVTINMSQINGTAAQVWWYNPSTNTSTSAGTFPTSGSQNFTPPSAGDWVLVIDNAALNLPAPGAVLPPPPPDTTTPTVSLTSPANGATVSGSAQTISASASDNVGVVGVQFIVNSANLGPEDTVSPYSTVWDTIPLANGSYTLSAVARDAAGLTATSTVTLTVNNPVPIITSFTANPVSVIVGSSSVLNWSVTGAASLSISPGVGTVTGTSVSVSPVATTTYTLTATNSVGVATAQTTVSVGPVPPSDTTPPLISNGSPAGTLPSGTASAVLSASTDENATCKYDTNSSTSYSSMANTFITTGGVSHSDTIQGLVDGGVYTYYVRCQDSALNSNATPYSISFSIASGSPSGSVSRTGVIGSIQNTVNAGSQVIAVPADATMIVVGVGGWNSAANFFSAGTVSLNGMPLQLGRAQDTTSATNMSALFYLTNPTTGSQTLSWDWAGATAVAEGANIFYAFYKGVDTKNPIRFAGGGSVTNSSLAASTGVMTAQPGDMVVSLCDWYRSTLAACIWTGTTAIAEVPRFNINDASWAETSPTGSLTITAKGGTYDYLSLSALVLKP